MTVAAVVADDNVAVLQGAQNGDSVGLLPDVGVRGPVEEPLREGIQDALFKKADAEHRPIELFFRRHMLRPTENALS